jgi:hypothetical protein
MNFSDSMLNQLPRYPQANEPTPFYHTPANKWIKRQNDSN